MLPWLKSSEVGERLIRAVRSGTRWQNNPVREKKAKFEKVFVASVREPPQMTYGLTVEEDHSHVTGGVVTHNTGRLSCKDPAFQTIPKHTKWAKPLRRVFIARPPPRMEVDYSQGELRVIACIANEPRMEAYSKGMDLHAITSGRFTGFSYEEMMALKKTDGRQSSILSGWQGRKLRADLRHGSGWVYRVCP